MKNLYLWGAVIIFVLLLIPFFEGFAFASIIQFLGDSWRFTAIYPILVLFGIIEGACITLYVQSVMHEIKTQSSNNFDL